MDQFFPHLLTAQVSVRKRGEKKSEEEREEKERKER
jgi:hypothetical protein